MITHVVRRTNPLSKWPWRIVRLTTRTRDNGAVEHRTHKLLIKFETYEAATRYLTKYTEAGLIDRLA